MQGSSPGKIPAYRNEIPSQRQQTTPRRNPEFCWKSIFQGTLVVWEETSVMYLPFLAASLGINI